MISFDGSDICRLQPMSNCHLLLHEALVKALNCGLRPYYSVLRLCKVLEEEHREVAHELPFQDVRAISRKEHVLSCLIRIACQGRLVPEARAHLEAFEVVSGGPGEGQGKG